MKSAIADFIKLCPCAKPLREPGPGREIAQNRNIDPRDSVVKDLTASRWSKHRDGSWRSRLRGPGNAVPANVFGRIEKHLLRAFFVEPSTDTKKTNWPLVGRMWKGSGWEDS